MNIKGQQVGPDYLNQLHICANTVLCEVTSIQYIHFPNNQ